MKERSSKNVAPSNTAPFNIMSSLEEECFLSSGEERSYKNLSSPSEIRRIMSENGFSFSKSLGQNFLIDAHAVEKIVGAAELKGRLVIEIGPGFGVLTQHLCRRAEKVICIEKDKTLPEIIRKNIFAENLEIIAEDVLRVDVDEIIQNAGFAEAVVVANLPYYITTPIIMKLLEDARRVQTIVVMMQREVADRILDEGDRGAITISAGYYASSSRVTNIGRNSFMPAPKVDSTVIKMERVPPRLSERAEIIFKQLVRAIYSTRRKTLINSVASLNLIAKNALSDVIIRLGYKSTVRGEELDLGEMAALADAIATLEEK